jgi:hypothetical protein
MRYASMAPTQPQLFASSHLFRTGCIEAINTLLLEEKGELGKAIFRGHIEQTVNETVERYFSLLRNEGLDGPAYLLLTFLNIAGYRIYGDYKLADHRIQQDDLVIPEVFIENLSGSPAVIMRMAYDVFWNACNFPRCLLYDDNGNWDGRRVYGA